MEPIRFETRPDRYRHWKLDVQGDVAQLVLEEKPEISLESVVTVKGTVAANEKAPVPAAASRHPGVAE